MPIARKLDRDTVNALRCNAGGTNKQFIIHLCNVWLAGQAADGTSVEYAASVLQEIAANATPKFSRLDLNTARFSKMTRLSDRVSPERWQCRVIDMVADEKSATVTITVDGTTGGVVSLVWDEKTNRWELPESTDPSPGDWASRGLLQLSTAELGVVAKVAVEFANWR